jgi:glycosyltransferase involved in cell wall biosynthesis
MIDISVIVSNQESFGVSVIEAGACENPVVVSNVGGLPEVVEDGVTGIIVPAKNPIATADAIEKLILDKSLRESMGKAGRKRVEALYKWENNVEQMMEIYYKTLLTKENR